MTAIATGLISNVRAEMRDAECAIELATKATTPGARLSALSAAYASSSAPDAFAAVLIGRLALSST